MDRPEFTPRVAGFEARVRDSFDRQGLMRTFGAEVEDVAPGLFAASMPYDVKFTQQHGFLHAGSVAAVLDSCCGFAALTLMDADSAVLTAEFKINLIAPAEGARFRHVGQVIKSGRTLTLTEGRSYAVDAEGAEKLIATMSATMMAVRGRGIDG